MKPKNISLFLASFLAATSAANAQSGTWTQTAAGTYDWGNPANWSAGTVADGVDNTASFTPDIVGNQIINLDTARTIGNITFTDATESHDATISGGNILTLDRTTGTPTINVTGRTLTISSVIAGADGLLKSGAGTLNLSGANTYSGTTTNSVGTLITSGTNNSAGGTTLTGGTLSLNNTTANNGGLASGTLTFNGVRASGTTTIQNTTGAAVTITNAMSNSLTGGSTMIFGGTQAMTFSGSFGVTGTTSSMIFTVDNSLTTFGTLGSTTHQITAAGDGGARSVTFNGTGNAVVNSSIVNGSTTIAQALSKSGTGTLTLAGANTYSGTTTVSAGTLVTSGTNNSAGGTTLTGGTLSLNNTTANNGGLASGTLTFNGVRASGTTTIQNTTGAAVTITNAMGSSLAGGSTIIFGGTQAMTFSGSFAPTINSNMIYTVNNSLTTFGTLGITTHQITGTGDGGTRSVIFNGTGNAVVNSSIVNGGNVAASLSKSDSGTLRLNGANTYTGTTSVSAGTLLVNGSLGTSNVTASGTGTFGGSGTSGANVTVATGATFAAGDGIGSMQITGNLALQAGSTTNIELGGTAFTLNGTENYDRVKLDGAASVLTLAGNLTLSDQMTMAANQAFGIIQLEVGATRTGTFAGLAEGALVTTIDGQAVYITYAGDFTDSGIVSTSGGNDVVVYTIPEPSAALLGGLGMLALLRRRRN